MGRHHNANSARSQATSAKVQVELAREQAVAAKTDAETAKEALEEIKVQTRHMAKGISLTEKDMADRAAQAERDRRELVAQKIDAMKPFLDQLVQRAPYTNPDGHLAMVMSGQLESIQKLIHEMPLPWRERAQVIYEHNLPLGTIKGHPERVEEARTQLQIIRNDAISGA